MKVAMYHVDLPVPGTKPGGVAVAVHGLAEELVSRGHEVTVLSIGPAPPGHRYRHRQIGRSSWANRRLTRLLFVPLWLNRVQWPDADVLHLHGDDWFLFRRRLATIRTIYGSALLEAVTASSRRRMVAQAVTYPLERLAARRATRSYGIGPGAYSLYGVDGQLTCGVDVPRTLPETERQNSILFVGTWEGRKRGRFLADVFVREVRPRIPDAELWLVSDKGIDAPGVRWLGAPSSSELKALYGRAKVFCLPSTYEGLGIPYVEAMANGAAVVASPNVGAEWVLSGGAAGVLAYDENLSDALVSVLTDDVRRLQLQAAGHARAMDFSWTAVGNQHEEAYEHVVAVFGARQEI